MSILARLSHLVSEAVHPASEPRTPDGAGDEALATAALLVHVARIDGRVDPRESEALTAMLRTGFGLSEGATERLVARAGRLDRETDDISDLIDMLGHTLGEAERHALLGMAYGVATADGRLQEFEDDLVWRLGRLLGLDERRIAEIRGQHTDRPAVRASSRHSDPIPETRDP